MPENQQKNNIAEVSLLNIKELRVGKIYSCTNYMLFVYPDNKSIATAQKQLNETYIRAYGLSDYLINMNPYLVRIFWNITTKYNVGGLDLESKFYLAKEYSEKDNTVTVFSDRCCGKVLDCDRMFFGRNVPLFQELAL